MLSRMKPAPRFLLAVIVAASISGSAFAQMSKPEFDRIDKGKITKNEAQHLALKQFPNAKIKRCELRPAKPHSVWVVELVKHGDKNITKVQIDGSTGKILP